LVRPIDRQLAQQIRADLVARRGLGRARSSIQRLDAHPPHHRRHRQPTDHHTPQTQHIAQHPAAREGVIEMQRVDPMHDR